jgi:hypothetical protein
VELAGIWPRIPEAVIRSSSSAMPRSRSATCAQSPLAMLSARAYSKSARSNNIPTCSASACGAGTGSSSRCHPSRSCCARNRFFRRAQPTHFFSNVAPQGRSITSVCPVDRSVRRKGIGLLHTPYCSARVLIACRVNGCASRAARLPGRGSTSPDTTDPTAGDAGSAGEPGGGAEQRRRRQGTCGSGAHCLGVLRSTGGHHNPGSSGSRSGVSTRGGRNGHSPGLVGQPSARVPRNPPAHSRRSLGFGGHPPHSTYHGELNCSQRRNTAPRSNWSDW